MIDDSKLVRRAPARPLVWLGDAERASDVSPALGERFPASNVKAKDLFDLDIKR